MFHINVALLLWVSPRAFAAHLFPVPNENLFFSLVNELLKDELLICLQVDVCCSQVVFLSKYKSMMLMLFIK